MQVDVTAVIVAVIAGVLPYFFGPLFTKLFAEDDELGRVAHLELELHRLLDAVRDEKTSMELVVLANDIERQVFR